MGENVVGSADGSIVSPSLEGRQDGEKVGEQDGAAVISAVVGFCVGTIVLGISVGVVGLTDVDGTKVGRFVGV